MTPFAEVESLVGSCFVLQQHTDFPGGKHSSVLSHLILSKGGIEKNRRTRLNPHSLNTPRLFCATMTTRRRHWIIFICIPFFVEVIKNVNFHLHANWTKTPAGQSKLYEHCAKKSPIASFLWLRVMRNHLQ